jgi:thiamine kinase-like enzyme
MFKIKKNDIYRVGILFLLFLPLPVASFADLCILPPAAQSVLKKILGTQSVESISLLQGGLSPSKLYKINTATQSYVLRFIDPQRSFADRDREIKCMEIASHEGIAPKVYYANPKNGIILMAFIQSKPLSKEEQSPKSRLPRLGHILKKLHDGPRFPNAISRHEEIRNSVSKLTMKKIELPDLVNKVLTNIKKIEAPLQKTAKLAPCHNDLNPNNILFTQNQIKIIDWEGSGMGDPYFDLASVALFFVFDPKDEDIFLTSYFGVPPTPTQKHRLHLMKQVALCFYGLALLDASHSKQPLPLSSQEIDELPDFSTFLNAIGEGKEKLSSPLSLRKFAFVAFKQAFNNMETTEFSESFKALQK